MTVAPLLALAALLLGILAGDDSAQQARPPEPPWRSPQLLREIRKEVRTFRKISKQRDGRQLRWQALITLGRHDHPRVAEVLVEELASERVEHFPTCRRLLAGFEASDTLELVVDEGLGHDDPRVRAQVLRALGAGRPDALDWRGLHGAALAAEDAVVRAAAVEALGAARDDTHLTALVGLTDDPSVRVRQRLPEALLLIVADRAIALLEPLAHDPSWRVRTAVVRALAQLRHREAQELLVDILEREPGRLREDVQRELERLTRQDYGLDVGRWRRYLAGLERHGLPPEDLSAGTRTTAGRREGSAASYYGLETLSRRIVVVTDRSGSMAQEEAPPARDGLPPDVPRTRMDWTKQELTMLVGRLDERTALDLVTFSDSARIWNDGLVPMKLGARSRALQAIRGYGPGGSTNLFEALELCFDLAERSLDDASLEAEAPDTLFVLTDGGPSAGRVVFSDLLLEYAAERNHALGLRIHTIALTREDGPRDLLENLSRLADGRFISPLD